MISLRTTWTNLGALFVALSLAGPAQAGEDHLEKTCHQLLQRYVFNCGCTTQFLEAHLGAEHADIVMRLWAYGVNDSQRNESVNLHLQYGARKVSDAVMNFHRHRDLLRRYCAQGDGPLLAD
jgi:hypothetical protein